METSNIYFGNFRVFWTIRFFIVRIIFFLKVLFEEPICKKIDTYYSLLYYRETNMIPLI